jgi:hypothetical protein
VELAAAAVVMAVAAAVLAVAVAHITLPVAVKVPLQTSEAVAVAAEFSPEAEALAALAIWVVAAQVELGMRVVQTVVIRGVVLAVVVGAHLAALYQDTQRLVAQVEMLLHLTQKLLRGSVATQQEFTGAFHERHNNYQGTFG